MPITNQPAIGIDLGTTLSAIAVYDPAASKSELIPNAEGDRLTPSAVFFAPDESLMVGEVAVGQAKRSPERVKRWVKRDMGNPAPISLGGRAFRPEEISAAILRRLIADAEKYLGTSIKEASITVPAYFNEPQRKATEDAARIAGLEATHLVNEPTAAGLTFGLGGAVGEKFLVYDLGGGTFDVSVIAANETGLEVLAHGGDTHLGGYDFDLFLAEHIATRFEEVHGLSPDPEDPAQQADWQDLLIEAEETKKKLSRLEEAIATARFEGERHDVVVSRAEFESLIHPYLGRTKALTRQVLHDAEVKPEDISTLLLVGGSTRIPACPGLLKEIFPHLDPLSSISPDEAVAQGAAVRAWMLGGKSAGEMESLQEVTAHSYGVLVREGPANAAGGMVNQVLIPANTSIPCEVKETFFTVDEDSNSTEATVTVTQGDGENPEEVQRIAATVLDLPANRPPGQAIAVTYFYDEQGRMHCKFEDQETGKTATLDHGDAAPQSMDPEDVDRASDDLGKRDIH